MNSKFVNKFNRAKKNMQKADAKLDIRKRRKWSKICSKMFNRAVKTPGMLIP